MTLQGNLLVIYEQEAYELTVKSFLLKGAYYFFIHDSESGRGLLSGQTLELVYTDAFVMPEKTVISEPSQIPVKIVSVVKNTLLENKPLWHYPDHIDQQGPATGTNQ